MQEITPIFVVRIDDYLPQANMTSLSLVEKCLYSCLNLINLYYFGFGLDLIVRVFCVRELLI